VIDFARGGTELSKAILNTGRAHLQGYGRSRRLGGLAIPFEPLRDARKRLGGRTVELLLTGVAGATGEWPRSAGRGNAETVLTAVPMNLRARDEQGLATDMATG
jgi:hypothetical protein